MRAVLQGSGDEIVIMGTESSAFGNDILIDVVANGIILTITSPRDEHEGDKDYTMSKNAEKSTFWQDIALFASKTKINVF